MKAFIWDSSRLEYEAARSCHLITAGDLFGRSGYGVGLQKGSPWADKVTLAILDFHESKLLLATRNYFIKIQIIIHLVNLINCLTFLKRWKNGGTR